MIALQFLGPLIASVLYVMVFQKAGFRGGILAFCAAPLVGSALITFAFRTMMGQGYGSWAIILPLLAIPLSLLPLLILAFKSWPPVTVASNIRSES